MRTMAYYPQPQFLQGYYPQPPMQDHLAQLRSQQQNPILWVSSEQEADQYPVAPNAAIVLWDSQQPRVYVKQADASGRATKKSYRLVEESGQSAQEEFVTRKEFNEAIAALRKEDSNEPAV